MFSFITNRITILLICIVLLLNCIQGGKEKNGKYIILFDNCNAVQFLKTLSKGGSGGNCNLKVECEHYYENALCGGYCELTDKNKKNLKKCFKNEGYILKGIYSDGVINTLHNSLTRKILEDSNTKMATIPEIFQEEDSSQLMVFTPNDTSDTPVEQLEEISNLLQFELNGPVARSGDQLTQINQIGYKNWPLSEGLWNLDRIDQRLLPLNSQYVFGGEQYVGTGAGVTIYVVDSGIRPTHVEFDAWQYGATSRAANGYDAVTQSEDPFDCDGHGTHIASTAIGRGVGVAKQAQVVGVRVLDCDDSGELKGTTGNVIKGLDWVSANAQHPAIVTLSLGLKKDDTKTLALEQTIRYMINEQNITFVVASGNSPQNLLDVQTSCDISPSHMEEVITVGASDLPTKFGIERLMESDNNQDGLYVQGNTGACVDIFAPGVEIYGACGGESRCEAANDYTYTWQSGTSMAVPHVAGAIAIFLGEVPQATPAQVKEVLLGTATTDRIQSNIMQPNTTNDLLYVNVQDMIQYYAQTFEN